MRALFIAGLLVLSMFLAGSPAESQTLEQVKKANVEKSLSTAEGQQIKKAVLKYSTEYGLEPTLVYAVIMTESNFNPRAKSPCGASGLLQLMPSTFKARGGQNIWSIEENIKYGCKHLSGLIARYKGNIPLALASYNAGGSYVDKFKGQVPSAIKPYVNRVYYHKVIIESANI